MDGQVQVQGESDDDEGVYNSVHRIGDEKGGLLQRCSMISAKLPQNSDTIDQNQTPSATHGDSTVQSQIQTLQRRILLREGALQSKNLTGDNTFGELHRGTRGLMASNNIKAAGMNSEDGQNSEVIKQQYRTKITKRPIITHNDR